MPILARLQQIERLAALIAVALTTAFFWLFAGLSAGWGLAGLVGGAVAIATWPIGKIIDASGPAPGSLAPTGEPATVVPPSPDSLLARVLEGFPAPAVLIDVRSVVAVANAAATDVLDLRKGQQLSLAIRSPELLAAIAKVTMGGEPQLTTLKFSVPVERILNVHISSLAIATPGAAGLLLVFVDRTEESQLAELRADFVANASHELRTPLASVKGFIETLQGAAKDDPAARERFLAIMHEQASRMSRLIEDLLSLSRVEMREHLAPREVVDLAGIADDLAAALGPLARTADCLLTVRVDERPALVRGDRDELVQAIQNLVQNAVKYGRQGGNVELAVARDGERIAVSVTDDGLGIAPEHLPRLTERFYRVNARASRERGGTGLGLAIVKHIVNRHRGELRIASAPGKGSTFTALLPKAGARDPLSQ